MNAEAYAEMALAQGKHWWYSGRREILRSQLQALGLPEGADILEVGSGTGANLDLLAEFGKVLALEMRADAIALARMRLGATAGDITMLRARCPEDLQSLTQKFDLICLFDVLEHIEQDELALAQLALLLKPGGRVMLTVPAYQWMWGPHDIHVHHKRRYTRKTLSLGCRRAGLPVARISYFNAFLFPLAVMGRMWEKWTGRKTRATQTPQAPVNALLNRIFASERHLLRHVQLPFGLSLMLLTEPY